MHYSQIITKIQSLTFWKKPAFILALILSAFFLKGAFLTALFPLFVGQDETKHFNSVEFLSEPRPITWPTINDYKSNIEGLQGGNYTEEIRETAKTIDFDKTIKGDLYNTSSFTNGYDGENEAKILGSNWKQYNEYYPINSAGRSLYHRLTSVVEKLFGHQNILISYFLIRIFSVLLGTFTILLSYLIVKNAGLSSKNSLLLTAIIAFQPRFSIYYAAINYDALLILTFALFTLTGVLALKNGLNWKNLSWMFLSVIIGIKTKGTGYILLVAFVFLLAFLFFKKIENKSKRTKYSFYSIFLITIIFLSLYLKKYLPVNTQPLLQIFVSLKDYLSESITLGRFALSSRTYWGSLGWVDNWFLDNLTNIFWLIETLSAIGVILLLFSKKKLGFLPEKKYVIFFIGMVAALQFGIRAFDWKIFVETKKLDLGTPGRYFLPNITAHIILVFTGIGALVRKKEWLERFLILGLILMMLFCLYIIFDVIVLRYYL
jgi:4-amino-4-deoxy-L-arabinose transferase-like glycosyltransferase